MLRAAKRNDLITVASWIGSQQDCLFWAGPAAAYPLDMESLLASSSLGATYCLDRDDSMVAFGMLSPLADGRGHLSRLIVAPALRGQRIGKMLVQQLLAHAAEKGFHPVGLKVIPVNDRAVRLYASLGFVRAEPPACLGRSMESWYMVQGAVPL